MELERLKKWQKKWEDWSVNYPSENIALAELIVYLNRLAKTDKEKRSRFFLSEIYAVKDTWIERNKENITEACESAYFFQAVLYAYTFSIEGQTYRFHSKLKLFKGLKYNPDSNGSAKPLTRSERFDKDHESQLITLARFVLNGDLTAITERNWVNQWVDENCPDKDKNRLIGWYQKYLLNGEKRNILKQVWNDFRLDLWSFRQENHFPNEDGLSDFIKFID